MKHFTLPRPVDQALFLRCLTFLALGDFAFIALNAVLRALVHFGAMAHVPDMLQVTNDDGLPEIYDYAKWVAICALLLWVFARTHVLLFMSFAVTFLIVLADDSLQLHELIGGQLAGLMGGSTIVGVRMQDFGELAVWGAFGTFIVAFLIEGFRRANAEHRALAAPLFLVFFALLFVAIGLDFVHSIIDTLVGGRVGVAFGLIEDGGEMLLASTGCAYAVALASGLGLRRGAPARVPS